MESMGSEVQIFSWFPYKTWTTLNQLDMPNFEISLKRPNKIAESYIIDPMVSIL